MYEGLSTPHFSIRDRSGGGGWRESSSRSRVDGGILGVVTYLIYPLVALGWSTREASNERNHPPSEWPATLLIVARDEESNLSEKLDSLKRCTYPNLEIWVVSDGSTDGTVEIAEKHPVVTRVIHCSETRGKTRATLERA